MKTITKKILSAIFGAVFVFNFADTMTCAAETASRQEILDVVSEFPNADLIDFKDDVKDIPDGSEIIGIDYAPTVTNRYSVDMDAVTMNITEYSNDSMVIDLVTMKTYSTVDLPDIVINEDQFTLGITRHNFGTDYRYPDYHGSSVTDVPQYNNSVVTHRIQVKTSTTRGDKFATITISKNLEFASKSVKVVGYAKIAQLSSAPYVYDNGDYKTDFRKWCQKNDVDAYFVESATTDEYGSTDERVRVTSTEAYNKIDALIEESYTDDINTCVYWIIARPKLSESDQNTLSEFFGNGFKYENCQIDALSDASPTPVMGTFYDVVFDETFTARPKYTIGMTLHYYPPTSIVPKIMFNEEYEGKINKLDNEQEYIKSLEGELNSRATEIALLKEEVARLKKQLANLETARDTFSGEYGDVNNDGFVDVTDAQLILNYYVEVLAGKDTDSLDNRLKDNEVFKND